MKLTLATASIISLASLAAAQDFDGLLPVLPDCSYLTCIIDGWGEANCGEDDLACTCSSFEKIASASIPCLRDDKKCSQADINTLVETFQGFCNSLGDEISSGIPSTPTDLEDMPIATDVLTESLTTSVGTATESPSSTETGAATETETEAVTSPADSPTPTNAGDGQNAAPRAQAAGLGLVAAFAAALVL